MKREKNRKLHGSVLLTVVFVMAVLIVFLFGTLTLALAANNRAHVNYSSAQTGITARAVAESAIKAIDNSTTSGKAYAQAIGKLSEGQEQRVKVEIKGDGASSLGHADEVVISYAGKKKFYDVDKKAWFERDLLKFTSTVTMAGVEQSSSVYVLKHYQDDNDGGGSGGAGFVTTADAKFSTQTSIFGGAYISLPNLTDIQGFVYNYSDPSSFKVKEDDGTVRQLIGTPAETQFTLTNSSAFAEADLYVCNNMYVENWSGFIFPGQGTGVTVWGDFGFHGNAGDHLTYAYHGTTEDLKFNKIPYVYVNGKIYTSGGDDPGSRSIRFGNTSSPFPLNVFCGQLEADKCKLTVASSIYCMDSDKENILVGSNPDNATALYAWSGSVINKVKADVAKPTVVGEVCSNGTKLTVDCVEIRGDVRSAGDLVIGKHAIIHGDVVCGGNLDIADGAKISGKIYNNSFTGTVKYANVLGYYYRHEVNIEDGKYKRPDGNNLTVPGYYQDGNLVDGVSFEDAKVLYYICNWNYDPNTDRKGGINYNIEPIVYQETDGVGNVLFADSDPAVLSFYAESKINGTENVYDAGTGNWVQRPKVEATDQKLKPVPDQYFEVPLFADDPDDSKYKKIEDHPEKTAYPKYAIREVLLGSEAPTGDAAETKVVKTMEEVLKNVANPYKAADLPAEMLTKYNNFFAKNADGTPDYSTYSTEGNKAYCNSIQAIKDYTGYSLAAIDVNGNYTQVGKDAKKPDGSDYPRAGIYIDKDIILDFGTGWGSEQGKDLVINPDGKNLLVVVKNITIPSSHNIMIDDSKGGNVYFYVDKDCTWKCDGTQILTKSYKDLLQKESVLKYNSKSSDPGFDIGTMTNVKPNAYVYGAKGSKLDFSNMSIVTANIISPYLGGTIAGGTGSPISSFYYDGFDIRKPDGLTQVSAQFIIGCLNAQNVSSANQVNVVYVTDDGVKNADNESGEDEFWYKVLYYSEF